MNTRNNSNALTVADVVIVLNEVFPESSYGAIPTTDQRDALVLDAEIAERARTLARSAGIEPMLGRRPRALSQGERQRAAICRALIAQPSLLLADEPTGNLDPASSERVLELLIGEARARGATLLMVTHDHTLLDAFDRVIDVGELGPGTASRSEA